MKSRLRAFRHNVRLRGRPEITTLVKPAQAGCVAARPRGAVSTASRFLTTLHEQGQKAPACKRGMNGPSPVAGFSPLGEKSYW
jgi:hypothetical protein